MSKGNKDSGGGCISLLIYLIIFAFALEYWKYIAFGILVLFVAKLAYDALKTKIKSKIKEQKKAKTQGYYHEQYIENLRKDSLEKYILACADLIRHRKETEQSDNQNQEKPHRKNNKNAETQIDLETYAKYCNAYLEHEEEMKQYEYNNQTETSQHIVKKITLQIDVDAYARYCNAYLEHQEEMEQYKDNN